MWTSKKGWGCVNITFTPICIKHCILGTVLSPVNKIHMTWVGFELITFAIPEQMSSTRPPRLPCS